jgi:hypothetical protein
MESRQKYVQAVKNVLINESSYPSVEFVRFCADRVCSSHLTEHVIDEFAPIVQEAFHQFIGDQYTRLLSTGGRSKGTGKFQREIEHVSSDEEFEGFFVVNVT